jgi:hypothetical protein
MTNQPKALEAYEHKRFGPVLGVSDEGSAAQTIVDAAYASAKAQAVENADAMCVGMIIDGERMGSAGEVPIGPDEYNWILPAAIGRTFCTTNVGVRVNTRFYQPLPELRVADAREDEQQWLDAVFAKFQPFINTPDGEPRPLTVRLLTEARECHEALRDLVPKLEAGRRQGRLGPPELHCLSFLIVFEDEISTPEEVEEIRLLMRLAADLGVQEVAIDGKLVEAARRRMSIQGLLNILPPDTVRSLLAHGQELGVRIVYHYEVDAETAARTVWTGLNSAFRYGLTAAKYGLFPLKLDQQRHVVHHVQHWMEEWTPIPAFYVDTALVTETDVYESDRIVEAARLWMDMISEEGAKVALVDAPDRIDPHRLLRRGGGPDDKGILTMDQLQTLLQHAQGLGLKVLWSGGNSAQQAFELGKLGVFGIFTTGSTARVIPVQRTLEHDKQLAKEAEPTELGVRRVHALLQGGFLCSVLAESDKEICDEIEQGKVPLLEAGTESEACRTALGSFDESLIRGWKKYWSGLA